MSDAPDVPAPTTAGPTRRRPPRPQKPPLRAHSQQALEWYGQVTAIPGAVLGLLYLVILIVPAATDFAPYGGSLVRFLDQSLTVAFAADYLFRLWLAPDRRGYARHHLFDLFVVAVPGLRPLRAMRSLQLFPGTRTGTAVMVVATALVLVLVGAVYEYTVEAGEPGSTIENYGDAVWWAVVTVTTVGYGDFYPVTVPGRMVAVMLMIVGIAIIGTVTATVSSSFMTSLQKRMAAPPTRTRATGDSSEPETVQPEPLQSDVGQLDAPQADALQDDAATDGPGGRGELSVRDLSNQLLRMERELAAIRTLIAGREPGGRP